MCVSLNWTAISSRLQCIEKACLTDARSFIYLIYATYFTRLVDHGHLRKYGSTAITSSSVMIFDKPWKPSTASCHSIEKGHGSILQNIPRNMHTALALLRFVVVMYWLINLYPSGLLHRHCGNLTIAPVPAKQPWWIWVNASCEFIMNDYITTTKQSTTKPCANFLGYTVHPRGKVAMSTTRHGTDSI